MGAPATPTAHFANATRPVDPITRPPLARRRLTAVVVDVGLAAGLVALLALAIGVTAVATHAAARTRAGVGSGVYLAGWPSLSAARSGFATEGRAARPLPSAAWVMVVDGPGGPAGPRVIVLQGRSPRGDAVTMVGR